MITVLSFILVLGFLIFIHELGHFLAARMVGVKVLSFSIGFPPKIFCVKKGDTEYMLSAIPLGGYVKLHGQNIDDEDKSDPTNYAAKTALQRFFILVAGPAMNLIAALIFMPMVFMVGFQQPAYLDSPPLVFDVEEETYMQQMGLQAGDEIIQINEHKVKSWQDVITAFGRELTNDIEMVVYRNGYEEILSAHPPSLQEQENLGWVQHIMPVIGKFTPDSAAQQAGFQEGDRIVGINGQPIQDWQQIADWVHYFQLGSMPDGKAMTLAEGVEAVEVADVDTRKSNPVPMQVTVERNGSRETLSITPSYMQQHDRFFLGIALKSTRTSQGFFQSFASGTKVLWEMTSATFDFMGKLFVGQGSIDQLGGPVKIGQVVGQAAQTGAANLLYMMAFISLQLGILNLLPIPVLDGGHIFFLLVEKLKGTPISIQMRERTQMVGFSILLFFMLVVTWNDIMQLV